MIDSLGGIKFFDILEKIKKLLDESLFFIDHNLHHHF